MPDLCSLTASELAALIRRRELSPVEVVDAHLTRIEARNPEINAFVTVLYEHARSAALEAERRLADRSPIGPLHGVPVAIKDLFDFKSGVRNTFGSLALSDFVADQTSLHVQRLESAGAIVVGKTNTPELGHKGITDNLLVGPTRNPFDLSRNAGGSSGGSAAAVASGMVPIAQGTDGGGSIRIPASSCGVFGFKPSYGRIADPTRPDAFLTQSPFIHIGQLARTVQDAALMFTAMVGPHPRDPLSLPDTDDDYVAATRKPIRGLRVAYSPDFGVFPVEPEVAHIVRDAVSALGDAEAVVQEIEMTLGHPQAELSAIWERQSGLVCATAFEEFERRGIDLLGKHRDELTPELVGVVEDARALSAMDVKHDQMVRSEVLDAIQDVFDSFDLLVTPTLAVPPVPNRSDGLTVGPSHVNGEEVDPLIGWCLTYPINFTGNPASSVPAGLTSEGLPIGMQIVGKRFADVDVLATSAAFEQVRPWINTYPAT